MTETAAAAGALAAVRAWGEARDWRGYDPYDGLNSPLAPLLTLGTPLGRRLLTQAVKLSPLNLRPLLGIEPALNAKALALVASGYARLATTGDEAARRSAGRWLGWLASNRSPEGGWGYHFPVQTRVLRYPRGTSNTIATSFAGQAFLDGCDHVDAAAWRTGARATAEFLADRMLAEIDGRRFFRYVSGATELIHNANALACAVLARTAALLEDDEPLEPMRDALETTLAAQRADGSWPYADTEGAAWVDNFHTAYVLESLAVCEPFVPEARAALERGIAFWRRAFFLADGTPRYFAGRTYPLDAHNYAQAIETWLALRRFEPNALERAHEIATRLIEDLFDARGYVRFQRRRFWTNGVPLIRWTNAPVFRALTGLTVAGAKDHVLPSTTEARR